MTHNLISMTIVVAILLTILSSGAWAQGYYNDSQGEGSYNGGIGGSGNYSGMENSQGAAEYYHGGGSRSYPGYGVPDHPAGRPSDYGY